MTDEIMVDSSIRKEFIKGKKIKLYTYLMTQLDRECFINEIVASELLFHFLAINGNKSPLSLKVSNGIAQVFSNLRGFELLDNYTFLSNDSRLVRLKKDFMIKYNLLPNDAIILATFKLHGITQLANHDQDFISPCQLEGTTLLRED